MAVETAETVDVIRHRFTTTDYHRMAEVGILTRDDRVELVNGDVVEMPGRSTRQLAVVDRLTRLVVRGAGDDAIVRIRGSIRLNERSEPQPDLALLTWRADFYAASHARPRDVLLVVEVVDSSLWYERKIKIPLYSRSGIPEVWLADVNPESVAVHREPGPRGYGVVTELRGGDILSPATLPGLVLTPDQVFGHAG